MRISFGIAILASAALTIACGNLNPLTSEAIDNVDVFTIEKIAGDHDQGGTQASCVDGVGTNLPEDYDWETDNTPEPKCTFESLADCNDNDKLEKTEAETLRACYQIMTMACFDVHEAVRNQINISGGSDADMNQLVAKKYWAAEKDFIRACLADYISSKCGN